MYQFYNVSAFSDSIYYEHQQYSTTQPHSHTMRLRLKTVCRYHHHFHLIYYFVILYHRCIFICGTFCATRETFPKKKQNNAKKEPQQQQWQHHYQSPHTHTRKHCNVWLLCVIANLLLFFFRRRIHGLIYSQPYYTLYFHLCDFFFLLFFRFYTSTFSVFLSLLSFISCDLHVSLDHFVCVCVCNFFFILPQTKN